ncbi:hypothetical protein EIN_082740, partial [Entamoeba invadens IP1]|uniref:hypothetical protein n=1 Tax=Entamoeba invadens IP1 TaxID=370355 RepID=UPI0002C3D01F
NTTTREKITLLRNQLRFTFPPLVVHARDNQPIPSHFHNPLITEVNKLNTVLEVDPAKVDAEVAKHNRDKLIEIINEFIFGKFEDIAKMVSPASQFIFNCIRHEVEKKWPESGLVAVGGIFFLRLINPAVVTPQRFGEGMVKPNDNGRRTLILLSKVILAIANQSLEPFNEIFMQQFNEFVVPRYKDVNLFLDKISQPCDIPTTPKADKEEVLTRTLPIIVKGICGFKTAYLQEFFDYLEKQKGMKQQFIDSLKD